MRDDIAAAARRVAEHVRQAGADGNGVSHLEADLDELLPVLDAVAAGREDAGRVERWARVLCKAIGDDPDEQIRQGDGIVGWRAYASTARAAIALADAERAVALSRRDTSAVV